MKPVIKRLPLIIAVVIVITAASGLVIRYTTDWFISRINPNLPVKGVDVSAHNGNVEYSILKKQGIDFAIVKATEGATFKDTSFVNNIQKAKAAGMNVGAYHFFRFDTPGQMQAINLIHSVTGRKLGLPLVIDIEETGNPQPTDTDTILHRLTEMIAHLRSSGYPVMLYTNKDGYTRFIQKQFDTIPLWICSFSNLPAEMDWSLWQYTHNGHLGGANGHIDINAFGGTVEEYDIWVANHRPDTQY